MPLSTMNPSGGSVSAPFLSVPRYTNTGIYTSSGGSKNSTSLNVTSPVYSTVDQTPALGDYQGYRVHVFNYDNVVKTLSKVKIAPSPTDLNSGTTLTYLNGAINGSVVNNAVLPAGTDVSDLDADDMFPGVLSLDYIEQANIARSDSPGSFPLLYSRCLFTNGFRQLSANDPTWRTNTGMPFRSYGSSYDFVTGNNAATPSDSYFYMNTFVEFKYTKRVLNILTVGDSTNQGVGTTSGKWSIIDVAAQKARQFSPNVHVAPLKFASSGRRAIGTYNSLSGICSTMLRPNMVLLPSWTTNDGTSTVQFATSWYYLMKMLDLCARNGIVPVVMTPPCFNGMTGSAITNWLAYRAKVLALSTSILVFDLARYQGDPTTGTWMSGGTGDGTHPNDTSTPIVGNALYQDVVSRFV